MRRPQDVHHRKCKSNGGDNSPQNLVTVSKKKHAAFHILFANAEAPEIAKILNETWLDPSWQLIPTRRKEY